MATPSAEAARAFVAGFRGRRLLVLGDLMLDRYLWGQAERISPEAPVPVVVVERETFRLGGAANVAHNLASLGAVPVLVGVRGADAMGERLAEEIRGAGIDGSGVATDRERRTTLKTRVIAHQQQVVRADEEDPDDLAGSPLAQIDAAIARLVPTVEGVIVSDYGKGVITPRSLAPCLEVARRRGVPVSVDPKENHFPAYRGVALLTPNQHEAGQAYGRRIRDEESLLEVGQGLRAELDADSLLVTRGAQGMSLFEKSGRITHLPTVAREVFDVTGAGDTVVSVFALALAAGADPPHAALLANHAAGLVIRHAGTSVATPDELLDSLAAEPLAPAGA